MRDRAFRYLTPLRQMEVNLLASQLRKAHLPKNEFGFVICQGKNGLTRGPVAHGTPTSVKVPVRCPPGSTLLGIHHSHPGGRSRPSSVDVRSAQAIKAKVLCVQSEMDGLRCYRVTS